MYGDKGKYLFSFSLLEDSEYTILDTSSCIAVSKRLYYVMTITSPNNGYLNC